MKKLISTICLMISAIGFSFAQENSTVYLIFTSTESESSGVQHSIYNNYKTEFYRYAPRDYSILDRTKGYHFQFRYMNRNRELDNPVVLKPVSFLDTVEYIDWDVIGPTLTKEQAHAKYQEIISHSKIYFIDRNDTKNGMIKMVPVVVPKPRY